MRRRISEDRVALVRVFLAQYREMVAKDATRVTCGEAQWVQLKLSCSRGEAERLVQVASEAGV